YPNRFARQRRTPLHASRTRALFSGVDRGLRPRSESSPMFNSLRFLAPRVSGDEPQRSGLGGPRPALALNATEERSKHTEVPTAAVWIAMGACAACGGNASTAFDPRFPDNREADLNAVLVRIGNAANRAPAPLSVGQTTEGLLYAFDPGTGQKVWEAPSASQN